jgi:hypothetical protein
LDAGSVLGVPSLRPPLLVNFSATVGSRQTQDRRRNGDILNGAIVMIRFANDEDAEDFDEDFDDDEDDESDFDDDNDEDEESDDDSEEPETWQVAASLNVGYRLTSGLNLPRLARILS